MNVVIEGGVMKGKVTYYVGNTTIASPAMSGTPSPGLEEEDQFVFDVETEQWQSWLLLAWDQSSLDYSYRVA